MAGQIMKLKLGVCLAVLSVMSGCATDLASVDRPVSRQDCRDMGFSCSSIGSTYANAGNSVMAERYFLLDANSGEPAAQNQMGIRYRDGKGVSKNTSQAIYWFNQAAAQGYASAQFNLGVLYSSGKLVPPDYGAAVKWYRLAAEQGHKHAQNNLANRYRNGEGVAANYYVAQEWYRRSAKQDYALARDNLASLEEQMRKTPEQDLKQMKKEQIAMQQASAPAPQSGRAQSPDVAGQACTDAALTARFDPELKRIAASSDSLGICGTGRAAADIFGRMIAAMATCPADAPGIAEFRASLQKERKNALSQAAGACS